VQRLWGILLLSALLFLDFSHAEAKETRLPLAREIRDPLQNVLIVNESIQVALIKQDEEALELALRDFEVAVRNAIAASRPVMKPHDRSHFVKLLSPLLETCVGIRSSGLAERRELLGQLLNGVSNIVRIYRVDPRFRVYFCPRDRLTWVQLRSRGEHPLSNSSNSDRSCALRAP
jgi:hypothetical protein